MTESKVKLLFAYPASEAFALSSLGYMWLYHISSKIDGVLADRVSVEACNVNSNNYDAVGFSMSFDFDFMGVFKILKKMNIPLESKDRNGKHPLIYAGGPVITTNPIPYEDIFDFMIIGDGESVIAEITEIIKSNSDKNELLCNISKIEGVYVKGGTASKRTEQLKNVIYSPIVCDKSYFKDTFIVEVSRGCMNRCAFCTASYTNLPFRNYEYEKIIEAIELGLTQTNKIALLGAQISAHPRFDDIMNYIKNKIKAGNNIELGISSLRTDSITPDMVETLVLGGQKHSTIAIEAASERLRKFVNKNLSEEQILNAINICNHNGLKGLKIYSMLGIPNESDEDIEEFINLAKKIKEQNKGFNIEFSFSTFVPKPHTPFQWSKREDTKSLEAKQRYLEKTFSKIGIKSKFSSAKWDYWQTVLSRSGSEILPLMKYVFEQGGKIGSYKFGVKEKNIDISCAINGFTFDEKLPWNVISMYPPKELLMNEYHRLEKFLY